MEAFGGMQSDRRHLFFLNKGEREVLLKLLTPLSEELGKENKEWEITHVLHKICINLLNIDEVGKIFVFHPYTYQLNHMKL